MRSGRESRTVQEAHGTAMKRVATTAHLLQPIVERARSEPRQPVASYREGGRFVDVSAADFYKLVRTLAKGLIASGVAPGDRVGLMSHTRLEWLLVDYAILATGAVTVPVYETSSVEQLRWILRDSGAVTLIAETDEMAAMHAAISSDTPACQSVFVIDDDGLDELTRRGKDVDDVILDERLAELTTDHLATIVYTSGTTGQPKGCVITHGNLRANAQQNLAAMRSILGFEEVSLIFLPLAHTLTKIIALVCSEWGIKMAFATDIAHLQEELELVRPTMVVAVPRVFEKVFNTAQHKADVEGRARIFDKAVDVAVRWSENRASRRRDLLTTIRHAVLQPLVYRKLQEVFGGRLWFAFSGGAPLGARLTHFFNGVGVKVLEGYGLTETSPTLTVNRPDAWKPGTVGTPLTGTSIRIAEDGEILAKGPQVFQGYWRNQLATVSAFDDDGWFRTGDIGALDEDGFLRITGRKKELLVTAGGKNVAPAPLEDRLRAHRLVSQALVVGDARPFITALITLDADTIAEWVAEQGLGPMSTTELTKSAAVRAEIQSAVDAANRSVSRAESIRQFALLPDDFTIERDELTATLKVRRHVVQDHYRTVIDAMYDTTEGADARTSTDLHDAHPVSSGRNG